MSKFLKKIGGKMLQKNKIEVLQINLGKKCNLACKHCHVEAGPDRTEELEKESLENILEIIKKFPQIKIVDLTGGAPEMNNGFKEILDLSVKLGKKVIVRSNLTIFFEEGYEDIPKYLAERKVEIVASLPCYTKDNVDSMRGQGVFNNSIKGLQILNKLGYGKNKDLIINLVYNTMMTSKKENFELAPNQDLLEEDYKKFLLENFGIEFNNLFAFTNIPAGRLKKFLENKKIHEDYIDFLAYSYNPNTLNNLMCKNQLSIDYLGNVFDCDFNQVEDLPSIGKDGKKITLEKILKENNLDLIQNIMIKDYCFGCTAGAGSSCGGALS